METKEFLIIISPFFNPLSLVLFLTIGKILGEYGGKLFSVPARMISQGIASYCCLAIAVYSGWPVLQWEMHRATAGDPVNSSSLLIYLLLTVLSGGAAIYAGVALARFLLRLWPIQESRGPGIWKWVLWALAILLLAAMPYFFVVELNMFSLEDPRKTHGVLVALSQVMQICIFLASVWSFYMAASLRHARLKQRPFVLFLRRFSTFADRTVVAEVLKATPSEIPAMFIASPSNRAGNWDPFVWSFSGFRFMHPFRNLPIQLRTSDETWHETVEDMVKKAACIVIDITDVSASIEDEVRLVSTHADPRRVVCVANEKNSLLPRPAGFEALAAPILYRPSYWRAIPRICFTAYLILYLCIPMFGLSSKDWLGRDLLDQASALSIASMIALIFLGPAIVRAAVSRKVGKQLRQAIQRAVIVDSTQLSVSR
jgi:hypothetical protein